MIDQSEHKANTNGYGYIEWECVVHKIKEMNEGRNCNCSKSNLNWEIHLLFQSS